LEINIYFCTVIFSTRCGPKIFDMDMSTIVSKSFYRRYPSNEKS